MNIKDSLKSLSHHAYYLVGDDAKSVELLDTLAKLHKLSAVGNPDFFNKKYQTFTIDDAREVKTFHETRPVSEAGKKIFILTMNGITVEAQNAMLKLLEEPAEYAHFFLIISSAHLLLPTVKSRLSFISDFGWTSQTSKIVTDAELFKVTRIFVTSTPAKRLEIIKTLLDDISKEKKTKQDAIDLLNSIQAAIYKDKGLSKGSETVKTFEAIEAARKYIYDRAPSVKMLLEYVALNI